MILSINGKTRGIGTEDDLTGILLDYEFREILKLFKGAPLAVFLCIALHTDADGHAFLEYDTLMSETGYGSRTTVSEALKVLTQITVSGHRILHQYRERLDDGTFVGSNHYRIFPDDSESDQSTVQSPESGLEVLSNQLTDSKVVLPVQKVDSGLYNHPAFKLYLEAGGRVRNPTKKLSDGRTLKQKYAEVITERIGDDPSDLEFWGRVVQAYNECGWSASSYMNMLEFYEKGCIPPSRRPVRHRTAPPLKSQDTEMARSDARARIEQARRAKESHEN